MVRLIRYNYKIEKYETALTYVFLVCEMLIYKAFKGVAVVRLLEALDNAVNVRL